MMEDEPLPKTWTASRGVESAGTVVSNDKLAPEQDAAGTPGWDRIGGAYTILQATSRMTMMVMVIMTKKEDDNDVGRTATKDMDGLIRGVRVGGLCDCSHKGHDDE